MDFSPNKTPTEITKKGTFGGTYFRDVYSIINKKMVQKLMERIYLFKTYWCKIYASDYYGVNVNKYGVKCGTSLRFYENKGWINKIDLYGWFQWYFRYWLDRRSSDDEGKINRWRKL